MLSYRAKGKSAMQKPKIYLETTLFNHYFDKDRKTHADTVRLFEDIAAGKYEVFTSPFVTDELEKAKKEKRDKMMNLITKHGVTVLPPTDDAVKLANLYVAEGIIPKKYLTDAFHIAIATVHDLAMIASLNFKHIVKQKTKLATGKINALHGYRPVAIVEPKEIVSHEKN